MDRLADDPGVDVIDELGCVPGDLLHADALRKTYGRCLRHNLDTTKYMQPSETWGRMPAKILSGDFYQLPPVPATGIAFQPEAHIRAAEAQILETICKNGPRRSPGGPNP